MQALFNKAIPFGFAGSLRRETRLQDWTHQWSFLVHLNCYGSDRRLLV
ncbi:MAG: hypothetical protein SAK29_26490 [Scytonema sp. PMC 1069.18]|nr:hypothetical protein [Scytonema sp. PMC 1069.18]MEC4887426.1 hypothetical protein [Scytonema sp. PMC 1070.18]